ncbi:MAG: hypothetical protein ACTSP4_10155 [Candidatus Hodarchaeales archaeon]
MLDNTNIETADAVLPFPDIGKIAYVFLFGVKRSNSGGRHTDCVASLSYAIDSSGQIELYKKIPFLKKQAKEIAGRLISEFRFAGRDQKLSSDLERLVTSYGAELEFEALEKDLVDKKVKIRELKVGNFDFLYRTIKKGLDKVMHALIIEKPIIVVGSDKTTVSLIVGSLELLIPFRILKKVEWCPENYIDPRNADIIGIDQKSEKYYANKDVVIIRVDKGKAIGKEKSKYLSNLLKELHKIGDEQLIRKKIENEISSILSYTNELIEICNVPSPSKEAIKELRDRVSSDVMDLILQISTNYNPVIADHVKREVHEAFADWLDSL